MPTYGIIMSREVKRVPLDFDWPLNKVWPGYQMSFCHLVNDDCDLCKKFTSKINIKMYDKCPDFNIEVPTGEGYQLWETISEGSPISPVFKTLKKLCKRSEKNINVCGFNYNSKQWDEILSRSCTMLEIGTGNIIK